MKFIDSVFAKLKRHPKRILFTGGTAIRAQKAAALFYEMGLGIPILLGKKEEVDAVAKDNAIDLGRSRIIDPATSSDLPAFCRQLEQLERFRKLRVDNPIQIMSDPHYFGAMMLQNGHADGLVGGIRTYSRSLLRALIQTIEPQPGVQTISSCLVTDSGNAALGHDGVLFLADCGVIPEPSVEQLGQIAVLTGTFSRQIFGIRPKVALLSFSTKGSAKTPAVERVVAACALARQLAERSSIEMDIDGELQADAALAPDVAERKAPDSQVAGRANVLIFPDLNSGNIASKMVQILSPVQSYGHVLLGLSKPAAEISRGAKVDEILGVAALVGMQAIEFRKLYPDDDSSPFDILNEP